MKKRTFLRASLLFASLFFISFVSAVAPTFITVPANSSLWYGNESLNVIFNATNTSAFGNYSINNTNFIINQIGFITNNQTAVLINATPLAVGNYAINVTINNTLGGANTSVTYIVQINKSNYYNCGIYFNTTSPITYPANFLVYANCSSDYTLYRNGSSIANASVVNSGAGYYNLTVQRTDTTNYTNTANSQFFTVNKNTENCRVLFNETSPLEYPNTFKAWANCTSAFVLARNGTTITNNSKQSLSAGAYNFSFQRTDTSNYSINYNQTQFRVVASTTTEDTDSGTPGEIYISITYFAYDEFSSDGEYFNLKAWDKINFTINETNHTLTLNKFNLTTAKITIQSEPIIFYLKEGILEGLDSNNDFIDDVKIRYAWINSSKAEIFIQEIISNIGNITNGNLSQGEENNTDNQTIGNFNLFSKLIKSKITPFIIVTFILIFGLVLFFILRKKYRRKKGLE